MTTGKNAIAAMLAVMLIFSAGCSQSNPSYSKSGDASATSNTGVSPETADSPAVVTDGEANRQRNQDDKLP